MVRGKCHLRCDRRCSRTSAKTPATTKRLSNANGTKKERSGSICVVWVDVGEALDRGSADETGEWGAIGSGGEVERLYEKGVVCTCVTAPKKSEIST